MYIIFVTHLFIADIMHVSMPELTRMSSIDSDYESRENTFSEEIDDFRGVCFRELSNGQFNLTIGMCLIFDV